MGGELWIDLFREVGLNEERMRHWHMLFEARHPEAHADSLAWLGLLPSEIETIMSTVYNSAGESGRQLMVSWDLVHSKNTYTISQIAHSLN